MTPGGLIRAFASMFLEEPHRATRSYRRILDRVGNDLFADGDKLEPYFLAALAGYRLEFLFRNGVLNSELRQARYEILLAMRLSEIPSPLPKTNSNQMQKLCKPAIDKLWDLDASEKMFRTACDVVITLAPNGLDAAPLRTEAFTKALIEQVRRRQPDRPPKEADARNESLSVFDHLNHIARGPLAK